MVAGGISVEGLFCITLLSHTHGSRIPERSTSTYVTQFLVQSPSDTDTVANQESIQAAFCIFKADRLGPSF
ncbi:hypothetical protein N658DRAFT_22739 [Parathielavia hyrcaniae]|uniref:Uncharacterized protein n=1 Tax=Parathielavia hyrcaniae TaxID=113614 RepID=A0AAN6QFN3_9PEZI|nr:hypothetical protein N658DRAFT_22739 [Parathielavia hyrcaniae]